MTAVAERSTLATLDEAIVLVDRKDGLMWTALNWPRAINAVNDAIRTDLTHRLEQLDTDDDVGVIVLRGTGEGGFLRGRRHQKKRLSEILPQRRDSPAGPSWIQTLGRVCKLTSTTTQGFCFVSGRSRVG
jgi:enoyl-CoA hydratase/carnithine racemase